MDWTDLYPIPCKPIMRTKEVKSHGTLRWNQSTVWHWIHGWGWSSSAEREGHVESEQLKRLRAHITVLLIKTPCRIWWNKKCTHKLTKFRSSGSVPPVPQRYRPWCFVQPSVVELHGQVVQIHLRAVVQLIRYKCANTQSTLDRIQCLFCSGLG